ncbi:spore germination protein (plasmid) [Bacillus toyonensis]
MKTFLLPDKEPETNQKNYNSVQINSSLDKSLEFIKYQLGDAPDLVIRRIQKENDQTLALVYLSELTDKKDVNDNILKPLLREDFKAELELIIPLGNISKVQYLSQLQESLLGEMQFFLLTNFLLHINSKLRVDPIENPPILRMKYL